jgi:hypothetical protein
MNTSTFTGTAGDRVLAHELEGCKRGVITSVKGFPYITDYTVVLANGVLRDFKPREIVLLPKEAPLPGPGLADFSLGGSLC